MRRKPKAAALAPLVLSALVWAAVPAAAAVGDGGATTTFTTSTSSHTTVTETIVEVEEYSTRVTAVLDGVIVYDQTVAAAPGSSEVQALEAQAAAALSGPGCTITARGATGSRGSTGSTSVDTAADPSVAVTTTTTSAIGPQTILVGENGGQSFFVAEGTVNFNTNTHTETFVLRTTTTTYLNSQVRQTTGTCASPQQPPPPPPVLCAGRVVTVDLAHGQSPTSSADVIRGTPGADLSARSGATT